MNKFLKLFAHLFGKFDYFKLKFDILFNKKSNFITYIYRPIYSNNSLKKEEIFEYEIDILNPEIDSDEFVSIVVQGPLVNKNDFTFETLKLYKFIFPRTKVIFSTWDDLSLSDISKINDLGVEVILSKYPDFFGPGNINLQIVSTSTGIKHAKKIGAKYVLKCRSDQRIYNKNILKQLFGLLKQFPIDVNSKIDQHMRIVGTSMNTFKYRLYGMSDMFNFGYIDDMLTYWDAELDTRKDVKELITNTHIHPYKFAKYNVCEVYLTTNFLKKIGIDINWTLEDSFDKFANHFCIINHETLDIYWGKYTLLEYRWKDYGNQINYFEELTFNDWLLLYQKYNIKKI